MRHPYYVEGETVLIYCDKLGIRGVEAVIARIECWAYHDAHSGDDKLSYRYWMKPGAIDELTNGGDSWGERDLKKKYERADMSLEEILTAMKTTGE